MIKKYSIFFLFFWSIFAYSQELENDIYKALDAFMSNKNTVSLQILAENEKIFEGKVTSLEEHLALVILQCNKAYFLKNNNNLKKAIIAYEKAWKRFSNKKLSNYDIIEYCLKPLGNLYTISRNYTNAENTINQYVFLAEKKGNTIQVIAGIINLSVVYHNIGDYQKAISILNQGLKISKVKIEQRKLLENNLSTNLIALKRYSEAQVIINNNIISEGQSQLNLYKNSSQIELQKGNYEKAILYFNQAKKIILKQENVSARLVAKLYTEEAQLLLQSNHPDKALNNIFKAIKVLLPNFTGNSLPTREMLYAESTFIDIFDLYGDIQNNTTIALGSYELSFYVSKLLADNVSSQEAKILNQIMNRARSEKCIELLYKKYRSTQNIKYSKAAFRYSEKSKAYVLKEVYQKKSLFQLNPNDSLLIQEHQLLQRQEQLTNSLIQEQLANTSSLKINTISKGLSEVSFLLISIKNKILKKYPKQNKKSISIVKLQKKLEKDNATLVEYFYGKNAIYQFIITENLISFKRIDLNENAKKNIINFIHFFDNASVINNNVSEYTDQAFNIFKLLNFSETALYKNVIIIPDGLLNFIPFEALLTKETTSINFPKMPFVVKYQNLVYNSSSLFYLRERSKAGSARMLGVFPIFKNTNKQLTYSLEEANAIENEITSTLFMNERATKSNFIENASKYSILHLSTHANSGTFTIPASIEFYDENMFLNELYSLDLDSELVVLSACETGIGKLQKGEGAMSIARGFQYAGVQNILFSLWQINDKATSIIMQSFYAIYNNKQSAYIANHDSKIDYLENKNISNIKKSPYYWSAFVYYGELTPSINQNILIYYIIGLIVLLILITLVVQYFKKVS